MTSINHPTQDEPIHYNEDNKSFNSSQIQQQQMIQQSMHNTIHLEQSTFASINVPNNGIMHELAQPQKIPVQYQQPLSVSLQNNNLISDGSASPSNDIEYPSLSPMNFKSVTPENKAKNSSITIKEEERMPCNNLQDCKLPSWKFNASFPFPRKPSTKKNFVNILPHYNHMRLNGQPFRPFLMRKINLGGSRNFPLQYTVAISPSKRTHLSPENLVNAKSDHSAS